mgnify:CR=1 FL=1
MVVAEQYNPVMANNKVLVLNQKKIKRDREKRRLRMHSSPKTCVSQSTSVQFNFGVPKYPGSQTPYAVAPD